MNRNVEELNSGIYQAADRHYAAEAQLKQAREFLNAAKESGTVQVRDFAALASAEAHLGMLEIAQARLAHQANVESLM